MTFKALRLACLVALATAATSAPAAALSNGGFESGDLSGWDGTAGFVDVVSEADDAIATPPFGEHYTPTEGSYFARLTAGVDLGVYTVLSQTVDLSASSEISGFAAFLAFDYLPYDDNAFVRVFSLTTDKLVFASSVAAVGDYGHTLWTSFATGPLAAGQYVIQAGVRDNGDFGGSSQLLLDGVQVTAAGGVPEPATWALLICGFAATGAMLRRRPATA